MNMIYSHSSVTTSKPRTQALRSSAIAQGIRSVTAEVSELLRAKGISVRVSQGGNSFVIGAEEAGSLDPIEFIFDSESHLKKLFARPSLLDFSAAYLNGYMRIHGSIFQAADAFDAIREATDRPQSALERAAALGHRFTKFVPFFTKKFESLEHYARSAEAYEQFLDSYMQYTCAHFPRGDETIDQAQAAKFRLIRGLVEKHTGACSGLHHLDVGCGWGGLVSYFASEFGMLSEGLTNTPEQKTYAKARYGIDLHLSDFLRLKRSDSRYDLVTIIGMIEHLTPYRRSQLLRCVSHVLNTDGVVYLQCIVKPRSWIGGDTYRLAQREVFPGHFLETHEETVRRAASCGFKVLEAHDHAEDYGRTTALWVEKIQQNERALTEMLGGRGYRLYLAYLTYASKLFASGRGSLMRYVLKKACADD